jgi:hypothetical protein
MLAQPLPAAACMVGGLRGAGVSEWLAPDEVPFVIALRVCGRGHCLGHWRHRLAVPCFGVRWWARMLAFHGCHESWCVCGGGCVQAIEDSDCVRY